MVERLLREKEQSPSCQPSMTVQADDRPFGTLHANDGNGSGAVHHR